MSKVSAEKGNEGEANSDDSGELEDEGRRKKLKLGEDRIEETDKNSKRTKMGDKVTVTECDTPGTSSQEFTTATTEYSSDDSSMETSAHEVYEPEETADLSSDDSSIGTSKRKGKRGRKKGTKVTTKKQASTIYQFKITLLYTDPVIWRRIQVPKHRFTFGKLHTAITEAMGWSGCFQYCFRIYDTKTDKLVMISRPNPLWQENSGKLVDETNTKITSYFPSRTTVAQYEYDFGDAWLHEILFEGEVPRRAGEVYPQCVDGERACPPEECGGVDAFEHICEVLKDPKHSEYEEIKSWLQYMSMADYDPAKFDPKAVRLSKSGDCVWVNK